jgi:hypothetical protein
VDIHTIHWDTVQFSGGGSVVYDVSLERLTQCGGGS